VYTSIAYGGGSRVEGGGKREEERGRREAGRARVRKGWGLGMEDLMRVEDGGLKGQSPRENYFRFI